MPPSNVDDDDPATRLRRMEALRRVSFAMLDIPYPKDPTPIDERRMWPIEPRR